MAFLKGNQPTSNEPEQQWFNQARASLAMGKYYEQKHDLEKAAECYDTVLTYHPEDTRTRVRLSKCYQKILRLEQAVKHQKCAMQDDPNLFQTAVNEASVNFELENFESSLIGYVQCVKRWKLSPDCNRGLVKICQTMENTLPKDGILDCLGPTLQKMVKHDQFFKESTNVKKLFDKTNKYKKLREDHIERIPETNYLPYSIKENVMFYEKKLSDLPKSNEQDKLISEQMRKVVHTFKTAKNGLYKQNPLYLLPCRRPDRRPDDRRRRAVHTIELQVSGHVHAVEEHCAAGDVWSAQRRAELALDYMDKWHHRPLRAVNALYGALGTALLLLNRDMPRWSDELNEKRILFVLGSDVRDSDGYKRLYHESYFGPGHVNNSRNAMKKLTKQINETKLSTYNLYLQYERIKRYLIQNDLIETRPLSQKMFTDAQTVGDIAWQVNSLMLSVICESRLCNPQISMTTLEYIIPVCTTLGNPDVTGFMKKIRKLFAEDRVNVHKVSYEEMRRADLIDIMPDYETTLHMRTLLHSIPKLS